ncbi:exported hypothetical protein [Candidatus Sulfotelmatobacter sp. SbA7]|nr:exported hypothetical protein [Candidatus Sulfotelmatobacter sp. SbA7]
MHTRRVLRLGAATLPRPMKIAVLLLMVVRLTACDDSPQQQQAASLAPPSKPQAEVIELCQPRQAFLSRSLRVARSVLPHAQHLGRGSSYWGQRLDAIMDERLNFSRLNPSDSWQD